MKITRTLQVSEQEFYDYLEQDILSNVQQNSDSCLHAQDIKKGLKYSRNKSDRNARIDVMILEYQRGTCYKVEITSLTDTIVLSYETITTENGLTVIFHQTIQSFEKKKHKKLMKMFSEGIYLGRMCDVLYDIQTKIQKNKRIL